MEFDEVIKNRYSCRSFTSELVKEDQLQAILEAGRLAPTARNDQMQRVFVAQGEEALSKVDVCSPCRHNAPLALLIGYDKQNACKHKAENVEWSYGLADAHSALVHMMLETTNLGLASLWVGYYKDELLFQEFDLPENFMPIGFLMIGYAAEDGGPCDRHFDRKPLEQTVAYL